MPQFSLAQLQQLLPFVMFDARARFLLCSSLVVLKRSYVPHRSTVELQHSVPLDLYDAQAPTLSCFLKLEPESQQRCYVLALVPCVTLARPQCSVLPVLSNTEACTLLCSLFVILRQSPVQQHSAVELRHPVSLVVCSTYTVTGSGAVLLCIGIIAHEHNSTQSVTAVFFQLHICNQAVITGRATGAYTESVVPSFCTNKLEVAGTCDSDKCSAVSFQLHINGPAVMTGHAAGTYTRVVVLSFVRAVTVTVCPHAMMPSVFFQLQSPAVMTGCTTGTYANVVVPYCTDRVTHERGSVQNGGTCDSEFAHWLSGQYIRTCHRHNVEIRSSKQQCHGSAVLHR